MKTINKQKGFVLLFTAVLSAVVLTVALGTANIAIKEINFSTSAKDTNEAFFAADTGAECALFYDKASVTAFPPQGGGDSTINCNDLEINVDEYAEGGRDVSSWSFYIDELGNTQDGCANVSIEKNIITSSTKIISKGYNRGEIADDQNKCIGASGSVERELELNYSF